MIARDAFALADAPLRMHLLALARSFASEEVDVFDGGYERWLRCYQVCQGTEIRDTLGAWIARHCPRFGPAIAPRFASLDALGPDEVERESQVRSMLRTRIEELLPPGAILVLPTTPCTALSLTASGEQRAAFYGAALAINAIAGHGGLPQLTLPAGTVDGKPAGLSFIGACGSDAMLLAYGAEWQLRIAAYLAEMPI